MAEIPDDRRAVTYAQERRHRTVIGARGAMDDDGRSAAEGGGEHWAAQPPKQNKQRPIQKMFVFGKPKPDPCKICKTITQRHPEEHPK